MELEGKSFIMITKNDGKKIVGLLLEDNANNIIIKTDKLGDIAIPKHEIRDKKEITNSEKIIFENYGYDSNLTKAEKNEINHNGIVSIITVIVVIYILIKFVIPNF